MNSQLADGDFEEGAIFVNKEKYCEIFSDPCEI